MTQMTDMLAELKRIRKTLERSEARLWPRLPMHSASDNPSEMVDRIRDVMKSRGLGGLKDDVHAIIKAMREPTARMVEACNKVAVFVDDGQSIEEYRQLPIVAWQAMIDEALES